MPVGFGYVLPVCLSVTDGAWLGAVGFGDMISTGNRELRCLVGGMGGGAVTQIAW